MASARRRHRRCLGSCLGTAAGSLRHPRHRPGAGGSCCKRARRPRCARGTGCRTPQTAAPQQVGKQSRLICSSKQPTNCSVATRFGQAGACTETNGQSVPLRTPEHSRARHLELAWPASACQPSRCRRHQCQRSEIHPRRSLPTRKHSPLPQLYRTVVGRSRQGKFLSRCLQAGPSCARNSSMSSSLQRPFLLPVHT